MHHKNVPYWMLCMSLAHIHLRKIDWLMVHTACLVYLVSTVNGCCKKSLGIGGANSGHITNLKQSIFSFNIYGLAGKFKSQIKSATTGVYDSNKTLLQWDNTLLKDVNSC